MESLDLWAWKEEPISPKSSSYDDVDDKWLDFDDKSESLINDYDLSETALYDEDDNATPSQVATKFLEQLNNEWIKEEPFADWLEDKVLLFDELPPPECGQNKPIVYSTQPLIIKQQQPQQQEQEQSTTTELLLQEFETVFDGVEACHHVYPIGHLALTPPQSPTAPSTTPKDTNQPLPIDNQQLLLTLQPQASPEISQYHQQQQQQEDIESTEQETTLTKTYFNQISGDWNAENLSLDSLSGDVDSELAAVDEYVRSCAEDMSPSSPCTSSNASCTSEDSTDDPEWTINSSSASSSSSGSRATTSNSNKYVSKQRNQRLTKTRSKPYSRPTVEDKKVRKKEQNKNAATRYRQKKKAEIKEIAGEEQELMDYNEKLNEQVKDLQREIGYLKGFMRDLCKAKGLIK